jgi:hypothetical protein
MQGLKKSTFGLAIDSAEPLRRIAKSPNEMAVLARMPQWVRVSEGLGASHAAVA